jgi:hypothetical protein
MMLEQLKRAWYDKVLSHSLEGEKVTTNMRPLKPEEAIGRPMRDGYPLLQGREVMIQAELGGAVGHAFTDEPTRYLGPLSELNNLPLETNAARARLVAAINATYRLLGLIGGTKHCKDSGPETCAVKIAEHLAEKHGTEAKVVMIGFQPAIAYNMSTTFRNFQVTDMDAHNVGKNIQGVLVESHERNRNAVERADVVLATGSTLVNGSIDDIRGWAHTKPLYFFGVTIAAAAYELALNRLCFEAS